MGIHNYQWVSIIPIIPIIPTIIPINSIKVLPRLFDNRILKLYILKVISRKSVRF
jgi:hypothetical protein